MYFCAKIVVRFFQFFLTNTKKKKKLLHKKIRKMENQTLNTLLTRKTESKSECHLRRQSARILSRRSLGTSPQQLWRSLRKLKISWKAALWEFLFLEQRSFYISNISLGKLSGWWDGTNHFGFFSISSTPHRIHCYTKNTRRMMERQL